MKSILFLLAFGLFGSMVFETKVAPGDPIPGVDIKLGRKPPGGIIATTQSAEDGTFEFEGFEAGSGYYLEFGIKEKGIRAGSAPTVIENLTIIEANLQAQRTTQQVATITKVFGDAEVTVKVEGTTIRGSINKTRSNIKN